MIFSFFGNWILKCTLKSFVTVSEYIQASHHYGNSKKTLLPPGTQRNLGKKPRKVPALKKGKNALRRTAMSLNACPNTIYETDDRKTFFPPSSALFCWEGISSERINEEFCQLKRLDSI